MGSCKNIPYAKSNSTIKEPFKKNMDNILFFFRNITVSSQILIFLGMKTVPESIKHDNDVCIKAKIKESC